MYRTLTIFFCIHILHNMNVLPHTSTQLAPFYIASIILHLIRIVDCSFEEVVFNVCLMITTVFQWICFVLYTTTRLLLKPVCFYNNLMCTNILPSLSDHTENCIPIMFNPQEHSSHCCSLFFPYKNV